jgi:nicotinamidase-related amidase
MCSQFVLGANSMAEGLDVRDSSCQIQPGLDDAPKGFKFFPELEVPVVDMRTRKIKYGAFTPGSSDLDVRLKARGIDTLLIISASTNVCCASTARAAMMPD